MSRRRRRGLPGKIWAQEAPSVQGEPHVQRPCGGRRRDRTGPRPAFAGKPRHRERRGPRDQGHAAGRGGPGGVREGTRGWDLGRLRVSAPRPEPSRLRLEERQPPLPELFSLLLAAAVLSPRLITNGVFHPHLIMQQMPVGPPPSGLTCWLGIMGPSDAP